MYKFCLEVMNWQNNRGKGFVVLTPPDSGFARFLRSQWKDKIRRALYCLHIDMVKIVKCENSCQYLSVYHHQFDAKEIIPPEYAFRTGRKPWSDPQWKQLPSRLCAFVITFMFGYRSQDYRQCPLVEDLLQDFDDGALCGASLLLDRGAQCSCLLQDVMKHESSLPVPLKKIVPQKFTTPWLVQTLRKIDQLPQSTEANVKASTDQRIVELMPGLQDVRQKTWPQMYFDQCTVFRGMFGRVNPLFQHPQGSTLILWKPGSSGILHVCDSAASSSCGSLMSMTGA